VIDEAEHGGHHFAIQRQGRAGDGAAAQRTNIDAVETIHQPPAIALEHLHVSQQMMREENRLRPLQMRVTRQKDLRIFARQRQQRRLQGTQGAAQIDDLIAQPHAHIQGDLVVARAAGVELGPGGRPPGQFRLDVHVDVFQGRIPGESGLRKFPGRCH
jgi:hypothetical protein